MCVCLSHRRDMKNHTPIFFMLMHTTNNSKPKAVASRKFLPLKLLEQKLFPTTTENNPGNCLCAPMAHR